MRMPLAVGRSRHGVQHSYGSCEALPVLRSRLARASDRDDRHRRAAVLSCRQDVLDLARPPAGLSRDVPRRRKRRRFGIGMGRRVLEPLELADPEIHRPYWKFLWDSNPPTYSSSPSSSGLPLRSSTVGEGDGGAVFPCEPTPSTRYRHFMLRSSPMRKLGATSPAERIPNRHRLGRIQMWGGLSAGSLLPAGFSAIEAKSRPEGGCRLIARPTFQTEFSPRLGSWIRAAMEQTCLT